MAHLCEDHPKRRPMHIVPQSVPSKHVSSKVYLLLSRAVPTVDGWFAELQDSYDQKAFREALRAHLEKSEEPAIPRVIPGA